MASSAAQHPSLMDTGIAGQHVSRWQPSSDTLCTSALQDPELMCTASRLAKLGYLVPPQCTLWRQSAVGGYIHVQQNATAFADE